MTKAQYRPLKFGVTRVAVRDGAPGVHYLRAEQALQDYPVRITDRLQHWAQTRPDQLFLARREKLADGRSGDWQQVSYAQAWAQHAALRRRCSTAT
jgi:feruloyl-CoA synthase